MTCRMHRNYAGIKAQEKNHTLEIWQERKTRRLLYMCQMTQCAVVFVFFRPCLQQSCCGVVNLACLLPVFFITSDICLDCFDKKLGYRLVFSCFLSASTESITGMFTWMGIELLHLVEISKLCLLQQIKVKPSLMFEITCNVVIYNKMCLCMSPWFVAGKTEV